MQAGTFAGEAAEYDVGHCDRRSQRIDRRRDRDACGTIGREAIDAGGNRGKGNRGKAVPATEFGRAAIAGGQRMIFAKISAVPYRSHGMNHMPRR